MFNKRCEDCRWKESPCDRCINNGVGVTSKWEPSQTAPSPSPVNEGLVELIVHMRIHSGYSNNGYVQMTTEQKRLYDEIWEQAQRKED